MTENAAPRRFAEELHKTYRQEFDVLGEPIVETRSQFQTIKIFDNKDAGRVLVLDDIVQLTERDECAYSEMLVHVPGMEHGNLRRVMIVGGGDGAVAEEALKYKSVERVDLVDIDGMVIELAKEFLPNAHKGCFADERLNVVVDDAAAFLKKPEAKGFYDLIVADRPDPVGPAEVLFAEDFYRNIAAALAPGGAAVFQTGVPHFQPWEVKDATRELDQAFAKSGCFVTVTPTYVGGFMALTWASNDTVLGTPERIEAAAQRYADLGATTDHYNPDMHRAAYCLPNWLKRLIAEATA